MKRATAVLIAVCVFLSACGRNGTAPDASLSQATTQPPRSQDTGLPAARSTPVEEPTLDSGEPTRENPAATSAAHAPTATTPGPLDPTLASLVAAARADLAKRRGVALDTIEVVEARSVTWPDPSLGCPRPGMAYKQVPVDGVLIRLRVGGMTFNYHGGGGQAPFLCE